MAPSDPLSKASQKINEEDLPYEEEVQSNRYSIRAWLRYLDFKSRSSPRAQFLLFERALKELPGSYKLWHRYVIQRIQYAKTKKPDHSQWNITNQVFERALVYMSKMPRIWLIYLDFLKLQGFITKTRHTFDRALQSLPITQHKRIWEVYIPWIRSIGVNESAVRVYRRYLKLDKNSVIEEYIDFLLSINRQMEAIELMTEIVNDPSFVSKQGKSKHQLWLQLCDCLSKHPQSGRMLNVEAIIRQGLENFTDQVSRLWTCLANYYIRLGNFEKARDVFEEALAATMNIRDFVHIWDAYTQFEDSLITAHLNNKEQQLADNSQKLSEEDEFDLELRIARYKYLIDRRPLLVSSVKLRQNPHNVKQWHKRVTLYENPLSIIETYTLALRTVDPFQAIGKPHTLWINFAKFYETNGDLSSARMIFEKAVSAKFRTFEHLASVWCEYIEMELIHRNFSEARKLIKRATEPPPKWHSISKTSKRITAQQKLFKSTRLWKFYVDIEESLGTFESTKAVYERILELRVATPELIINYANFLEEHRYFEESFKAFERGVNLFQYPYALEIWMCYLKKFIARYEGTKIERTRDLFEQAIESVPPDLAKIIYISYAEYEEQFGYARHAMTIYDRATRAVADSDKYGVFQLYIGRATEFFGVTRTREIYERAIQTLPDKQVVRICLQYADLECKLGEIDRARAIYVHSAQFADPRSNLEFWNIWREFEVRHGNVDTFREMLRIRRSVQAQYNTQVNFVAAQVHATDESVESVSDLGKRQRDEDSLQVQIPSSTQVVPEKTTVVSEDLSAPLVTGTTSISSKKNEEEIELDLDDDDDDEEAPDLAVEQRPVPASVFGSAKPEEYESKAKPKMGALERLRARK